MNIGVFYIIIELSLIYYAYQKELNVIFLYC